MAILVSGSLVYDHIMNFPDSFKNHILPEQIHILNVAFTVDRLEQSFGGTAGNIAYTIKLLGATPVVVSALGRDSAEYLKHWNAAGLDARYIKIDDKKNTAAAYITTDADDNQITAFFAGPLDNPAEVSVGKMDNLTLAIVSPTYKEAMKKHLKDCFEAGIKTVFDPGQQITGFDEVELRQMISQAHFVVGNDYEIKLLEQKTGWDRKKILENCKVLIITFGDKGSAVATADGEMITVGVCPAQSYDDPTGAGDAYRAGFFVGYELGYNWKTCAQMGAVAASYAIESYGTQAHKFSHNEFCERYEKAFQEKINLIAPE